MRLLITFFITLSTLTLNAQFLIPKAGVTVSTFNTTYELEMHITSRIGLFAGLGYNISIGKKFSIQPEFIFVQMGHKYETKFDIHERFDKTRLNYLQAPVMFNLTFGKANRFYVNAGPSLGFGINGKLTQKTVIFGEDQFGNMIDYTREDDYKLYFKKDPTGRWEGYYIDNRFNLSVQVGGGVTLMEKINVDIRYGIGLTDIYDNFKSKNKVLQITLGVPIKL